MMPSPFDPPFTPPYYSLEGYKAKLEKELKMGMFDSVWIKCPKCGKEFEQQSKAGACRCRTFHLSGVEDDIPADILEDLKRRDAGGDCKGYNMTCDHCGCPVKIKVYGKLVARPFERKEWEDDED